MKAINADVPSVDALAYLVRYDAETGKFTCRATGRSLGLDNGNGYLRIYVGGYRLLAHRVAVALTTGAWPEDIIDHANGIKSDNRLSNLRVATNALNQGNRRLSSLNTSGMKGVSRASPSTWRAGICFGGVRRHLGTFKTVAEAHAAYQGAARILFGEFARFA